MTLLMQVIGIVLLTITFTIIYCYPMLWYSQARPICNNNVKTMFFLLSISDNVADYY